MNTAGDADNWRFALARMGVPLDDLPFFPSQKTPETNRIKIRIQARLTKYESSQ